MILLVKKNSAFFIPYFIFLLTAGCILVFCNKLDIYLFINEHHWAFADILFTYWTNIGLGWLIIPVAIALAFVRIRFAIISVVCFLVCFLINDSIKSIVKSPRPIEVLTQAYHTFYSVPNVEIYHWNSFPSGHSAIAFCSFSLLAIVASNSGGFPGGLFKDVSFRAFFN
jgi:membrane-associated phospholipid phosphatase